MRRIHDDLGAGNSGLNAGNLQHVYRHLCRQMLQRLGDAAVKQSRPGKRTNEEHNRKPGDFHHLPAAKQADRPEERGHHSQVLDVVVLPGPDSEYENENAGYEDGQT